MIVLGLLAELSAVIGVPASGIRGRGVGAGAEHAAGQRGQHDEEAIGQ